MTWLVNIASELWPAARRRNAIKSALRSMAARV